MVLPDLGSIFELFELARSGSRPRDFSRAIPPVVPNGNEYRLPPHLIPELYALTNITKQRANNRPYLTGSFEQDSTLSCSPEAQRIIRSGFFSPNFSIAEVPVWKKRPDGALEVISSPTFAEVNRSLKEFRNIAIGIIVSLALDYQRAKNAGKEFSFEYINEEKGFFGRARKKEMLLSEKKKTPKEKQPRIKRKNARRQVRKAIWGEYWEFSKSIHKVIHGLSSLPEKHPLYWMFVNYTKLIAMSHVNPYAKTPHAFILRGLNTFRSTMFRTNRLIADVAKKQNIKLTSEDYVSIFEESANIPRTLANMHIRLFGNAEERLLRLGFFKLRFDPKYFSLVPVDSNTTAQKRKLVFNEMGNKVLAQERRLFEREVNANRAIDVTTRCPARRDGVAKVDDIILNLHQRVVSRAKRKLGMAVGAI